MPHTADPPESGDGRTRRQASQDRQNARSGEKRAKRDRESADREARVVQQRAEGKRGGRPVKAPDTVKGRVLSARYPDSLADRIESDAARCGLKPATYIREQMKGKSPRVVPELNRDAWSHLGLTAGGLTQMAKAAQEGRIIGYDGEAVEALRSELAAVRRLLLGYPEEYTLEDDEDESATEWDRLR